MKKERAKQIIISTFRGKGKCEARRDPQMQHLERFARSGAAAAPFTLYHAILSFPFRRFFWPLISRSTCANAKIIFLPFRSPRFSGIVFHSEIYCAHKTAVTLHFDFMVVAAPAPASAAARTSQNDLSGRNKAILIIALVNFTQNKAESFHRAA